MAESVTFTGKLVRQTPDARLLRGATGIEIWIPKSITNYYSNDGTGNCKFRVEGWKNRDIRQALFDEI